MSLENQNPIESKSLKRTRAPKDVDFCKIGGLQRHIKTLREVVIFPLLHGNVFSHFNIKPPRGVLFHGPPGTGKTLAAAALATELNKEGVGKVSFFQRKGADILDKWVGGSEKNLRDLFEKAAKSRPAIIFFDELDGLAPVRQKQNDQVHASIVATLLALMDGLDNKPGLIVIGATNRIEAIDPALRRPGRFDKELYFPLPGAAARTEILQVHTASWKHKPSPALLACLVESTSGFSGADLQALCYDAILRCMKRIYPCLKGIKIDPDLLKIGDCDFVDARLCIMPSALRDNRHARNLSPIVRPLLEGELEKIMYCIRSIWPHFLQENFEYVVNEGRYAGRLLLVGANRQGLNAHLVPAVLQNLEYLPVFAYDATKLFKIDLNSGVPRNCPSIILLSRVDEWWNLITECEQLNILSALDNIHAGLPILVIATCRLDVPTVLNDFFYNNSSVSLKIDDPTDEDRLRFFKPLFFDSGIIASLHDVLENSKKSDPPAEKPSASRKRKIQTDDDNRITTRGSKRKRESAKYDATQRKEDKENLIRSSSVGNVDDMRKQQEDKSKGVRPIKSESLHFLSSGRNGNYFCRILSELLRQRDARNNGVTSVKDKPLDRITKASRQVATSNVDDRCLECRKSGDAHMRQIYDLWRRVSLETSKNMAVAQLELLYDVIAACIGVDWSSFEVLIKNLESILENMETSSKPIES
ncbi:uncharacterized protein LOC132702554 [Cylas formicarius]|uniref:uncharacterized protein LOC132702554 n=1 Tax=Cylas formicarius TaxID=197179 RepID=UPI002958C573|nr:uncharacterized protein LOC132702554 [Cylas formicarius]